MQSVYFNIFVHRFEKVVQIFFSKIIFFNKALQVSYNIKKNRLLFDRKKKSHFKYLFKYVKKIEKLLHNNKTL